jgi:hypothetical protein
MGDGVEYFISHYNNDDVYFYDEKKQKYRKICDVGSFGALPLDVKRQIKAAVEEATDVLKMPIE